MKSRLEKFDLNLLVAFDAMMTERSVTRAGRNLGITQAAMSNTLRRLREIFDDPLFVKSGNRMEPTARALELAEPIEHSLRYARQALRQERFDPFQSRHVFRIGMVDYISLVLFPRLVEHLAHEAPRVVLELVDTGGEDEAAMLDNGSADLVISRFQWVPPKVVLHRLFESRYVALYRRDHPLSATGALSLDDFLRARFVHYYPRGMDTTVVDEALTQMGTQRMIVARLYSLTLMPGMLRDSDLVGVVPEYTARCLVEPHGLSYCALPFETPPLRMALAWHPRTDLSPPDIWIRERLLTLWRSIEQEFQRQG
ncbi:MAG: LysR family transcriptional regulator [Magnetococcus sp. WYHC-3]